MMDSRFLRPELQEYKFTKAKRPIFRHSSRNHLDTIFNYKISILNDFLIDFRFSFEFGTPIMKFWKKFSPIAAGGQIRSISYIIVVYFKCGVLFHL